MTITTKIIPVGVNQCIIIPHLENSDIFIIKLFLIHVKMNVNFYLDLVIRLISINNLLSCLYGQVFVLICSFSFHVFMQSNKKNKKTIVLFENCKIRMSINISGTCRDIIILHFMSIYAINSNMDNLWLHNFFKNILWPINTLLLC